MLHSYTSQFLLREKIIMNVIYWCVNLCVMFRVNYLFFCTLNLTNNINKTKMNIYWPVYKYRLYWLCIRIIETQSFFWFFFSSRFIFFYIFDFFFLLFFKINLIFFLYNSFFCVVVVVWGGLFKITSVFLDIFFSLVFQTIFLNANYILSYYHFIIDIRFRLFFSVIIAISF